MSATQPKKIEKGQEAVFKEFHLIRARGIKRRRRVVNSKAIQEEEPYKPLVVVIGWINCSRRNLSKYLDLYLNDGVDALWFPLRPTDVIFPTQGRNLAYTLLQILTFLLIDSNHDLIFHVFSGGAYMYGQILDLMDQQPERFGWMKNYIVAQIFDSPVEAASAPSGISKSATNNTVGYYTIYGLVELYLAVTYPWTKALLWKSSEKIHNNTIQCPSLFLFSKNDPIARYEDVSNCISDYKRNGLEVYQKCWDTSTHVGHLREHPEEYKACVDEFVQYCLSLVEAKSQQDRENIKQFAGNLLRVEPAAASSLSTATSFPTEFNHDGAAAIIDGLFKVTQQPDSASASASAAASTVLSFFIAPFALTSAL
eukprot:GEZU01019022.1.p1 GENE.GEZU01019022.1~~GEZU01019022.1.p1  ORF type:complete len:368 (-),score=84.26 GEZU01019022.1:132-1235(-)